MEIVYKIRRKSDGKFSTGGSIPGFTKNGKIWKKKSHVQSHITQATQYSNSSSIHFKEAYKDCEVVEYVITELSTMPVMKLIEKTEKVYAERRKEREKQYLEWQKKYHQQQLDDHQKKLDELTNT